MPEEKKQRRSRARSFADTLDVYLETASEDQVRGIVGALRVWARVRRFSFTVDVKEIGTKAPSTATAPGATLPLEEVKPNA